MDARVGAVRIDLPAMRLQGGRRLLWIIGVGVLLFGVGYELAVWHQGHRTVRRIAVTLQERVYVTGLVDQLLHRLAYVKLIEDRPYLRRREVHGHVGDAPGGPGRDLVAVRVDPGDLRRIVERNIAVADAAG